MSSVTLPRTFHARKSTIGAWIGALVAVSGAFFGLGAALGSGKLMIRASFGLAVGIVFLVLWLVRRVTSVTVEPGAVLLGARRFATAGARVTALENRLFQGQIRRSFWISLPDGSGGKVERGFTSMLWPEIDALYAALRAAGVEEGMPYPR
jgi:hypothetical protein